MEMQAVSALLYAMSNVRFPDTQRYAANTLIVQIVTPPLTLVFWSKVSSR